MRLIPTGTLIGRDLHHVNFGLKIGLNEVGNRAGGTDSMDIGDETLEAMWVIDSETGERFLIEVATGKIIARGSDIS